MNKQLFRFLIISKWLFIILTMILHVVTKSLLPHELKAYFDNQQNLPLTITETILLWVVTAWLALSFLDSIGLFIFKNWARKMFVFLFTINILITPIGATVMTGWTMLACYLSAVIDGMLIALMYFSPINEQFETEHRR